MEAPSDNLAQLSTPLPRQSSAKSSNRLPEFASLQLNPAPKLSSPFQTPTTTTMDYHSDTSLESVEIRNSYSKGSAEATGVSDQVCESKDIVKNTILEDKCESRNGESKAVPKAAASKGPTLPAANGPEEPANVTSNTHSDDRAESLEDGQQTNEVHPASPSGPVILTLVPRTHTTPAEGHVDMTLTPIDGVGASISIAKDDGGLPQTPSSFPSEIGPAPACDRRLSLPDMNASAPVTGDQVSTEKAPAAESDEIPLTERPGVGGGGGSNGCEDAAAIGKEDSFSTEGRGRDMVPSYLRTQPPSSGRPFGSQASQVGTDRDFHEQTDTDMVQNITTPEVVRTPEAPRYRSQYTPSYQQPIYRRDGDRDELPRLQAMLLKARQDLASERLINQNARITVEAETRQNVEAGFMSMLAEVLSKQAELVKQEALLKVRELDIQRRAEQVEQLEVFLAEGQKQLYRDLEERGGRPFNSVELEYARRQGQTDALSKFRGVEAKLEAKLQQLNVREAGLDFRERHYKAQIRDALETELREVLEVEVATRISEAEYGRGFTAGKRAGRAESDEEVRRDGFSQGYTACLETQERLKRLRAGQIPHDSPELDFLVDLSHPDNPLIRGVQIGRYEEARKKKK